MTTAPKPLTGRCLCGAVTYSADAEPVIQAACHCTDCQRQTGSPFSVETERSFCSACGSPVFSISALAPELTLIKAGSLDDALWLEPSAEFWTSSAQPWSPQLEPELRLERGPPG